MIWTAIPSGAKAIHVENSRATVFVRLDLEAPRAGALLCRPVRSASMERSWNEAVPPPESTRIVLAGSKRHEVSLVVRGKPPLDATFTPAANGELAWECPALQGDERLLIGTSTAPEGIRVFQLPGLQPLANVVCPDGTRLLADLRAVVLELDPVRGELMLLWHGSMELTDRQGRGRVDLDVRFVPAIPLSRIVSDECAEPLASPTTALPIDNRTQLRAATFPWQLRPPTEAMIVVVKGTFDLVDDAPARLADEQIELSGEQTHEGGTNVAYPGDFAPFKPKADIILRGHAYAKPGAAIARIELRLGALSSTVVALGPRRWLPAGHPSEPMPFDRVPLNYEQAFGGPGFPANPIGVGHPPAIRLPQVERPDRLMKKRGDTPPPAGFGPIPATWELRARKMGTYDKSWLSNKWPYMPKDFDWSYWNAAPAELLLETVRGDEAYRITSVLPGGGDLAGWLPGTKPRVFAEQSGDRAVTEVLLRLDTVVFDADRRKLVMVYRGALEQKDTDSRLRRLLVVDEPLDAPRALDEIKKLLLTGNESLQDKPLPNAPGASPLLKQIRDELAARRLLPKATVMAEVRRSSFVVSRPAPRVSRAQVEHLLFMGEQLAGRDLSGVDLSGMDLSGRDLAGAVLKGAKLDGAKLDGANCEGLRAMDVHARGSTWVGAKLGRADFARAHLEEADFSNATLDQASFSDAELAGMVARRVMAMSAQFVRARLSRSVFDEARLEKADFSYTTLDGSSFYGACLDDARFYEAIADGIAADKASLVDARFEAVRFEQSSFREVRARGSMWERASLPRAEFSRADLQQSGFAGAILEKARFQGADLAGAKLSGCDIRQAVFLGANLMRAILTGADARGAWFSGANLYQAETLGVKLDKASLSGALLNGTKLAGS